MLPRREKLLHAMVFFHENTRHCHKVKLYKLLHSFDFELYRETGRSPTGLLYYAYPMGPVPKELQNELRDPPADIREAMAVTIAPGDDRDGLLTIRPHIKFDEKVFTKRELREMRDLVDIYRDALAEAMSTASHDARHPHGRPWHQVHEVEGREWALIPYELALDDRPGTIAKDRADEMEMEARAMAGLFR